MSERAGRCDIKLQGHSQISHKALSCLSRQRRDCLSWPESQTRPRGIGPWSSFVLPQEQERAQGTSQGGAMDPNQEDVSAPQLLSAPDMPGPCASGRGLGVLSLQGTEPRT